MENGINFAKTEVQKQLTDDQKTMTPTVNIYAEGTVIAYDEESNTVTAKDGEGNPATGLDEIHSAKNYVYAITLTPAETKDATEGEIAKVTFVAGNLVVGEAQQIVPQGLGDASEDGTYSLALTHGAATGGSAQIYVENPDMVGTLTATTPDNNTDVISLSKDGTNDYFTVTSNAAGIVDITIDSDLVDVTDVIIHVTVTEGNQA
ncbi:hypothetical protein Zmor_008639 [Zophobas morio]|uniref:Uncharacterized protein n=1 Tax=Zophobas morio TaxID=2755281 RepID=A0AA38LZN1_9CUCU|nr:hypothetical protein Zmor_008639 [Zophobas morio]